MGSQAKDVTEVREQLPQMEDLLHVGTGDLDKGLCCSTWRCMSPNPAAPSSRSRNSRQGRSRVGNTNRIAFSKYVRGPQSARSKGPPTLQSNAEAENDDQRPRDNRE